MARRRLSRRRKPRRKRKMRIPRLLGKSQLTRMRFVKGVTLNPGAGAIISRVFSASGITVCDVSAGTGQPTGFDQFNAFFGLYHVLSATCKMTFVPNGVGNVIPGVYGVFKDDDATLAYADYQTLLMGNQSVTKSVKLAGILGDTSMKSTSASYNSKRTYGRSTSTDLLLHGDAAANPTESQFFQCWYGSPDVTVDSGPAHFLFQLDYVVRWKDNDLTIVSTAPA